MFSIHAPGPYIPPDEGVTKGMLTCHLGLIVSRDRKGCRMRVDDRVLSWQASPALIFDDIYRHDVCKRSSDSRVTLLIQFARPLDCVGSIISNCC
jgi:beta-hydroxylase